MAPYVRQHGKQLAIVHGARDKETGKVQQRTLFTLYSKVEAEAAARDAQSSVPGKFCDILETAYPQLQFNWAEIGEDIRTKMNILPDLYPVRQVRNSESLKKSLDEFLRQLIWTDPQSQEGRTALNDLAPDFKLLSDLLTDRLSDLSASLSKTKSDAIADADLFSWRKEIARADVPEDIEEKAARCYEIGDYASARGWFCLLVRCFPEYAEGYNYLGLIALAEQDFAEAIDLFRKTVEFGRKQFPRKIAQEDYWTDLSTRSYIRGLTNLAHALICAGQSAEALKLCDKLDAEHGIKCSDHAAAHRSTIYLNLQRWNDALIESLKLYPAITSEGFNCAYALFELGRTEEATEIFVHAALNDPVIALYSNDIGVTGTDEDLKSAREYQLLLCDFFAKQSAKSKKFFHSLAKNQTLRLHMAESRACQAAHLSKTETCARDKNYERITTLRSQKFAKELASKLFR